MHRLHDADPKILDDAIVAALFGDVPLDHRTDELRLHVVLRSRYAEDRLAAAVERGVAQYVLLGAGYDTFAFRQPRWAKDLTIFEADRPETQTGKRKRLAAAGISLPENLRFVPTDFASESIAQTLAGAGFDARRAAFFSWLGVTMYLPEAAVDAVLAFVAGCTRGSEIVFTFAQPQARASFLAQRAAMLGEPWLAFYTVGDLENKLTALGYSSIEFLTPELATHRYALDRRTDSLRPPKRTSIVSASLRR